MKAKKRGPAAVPFPARQRRLSDRQVFLIILGLNIIFAVLQFDPKLAPAGDNATYLILARSLLQGSYRNLFDPLMTEHTLYPPGLPALIAPAVAVAGDSFVLPKLVILLCSFAVIGLCYGFFRRVMPGNAWIFPLMLVALCPLLFVYSHDIFSEMPFLCFSLLGLLFFQRALENFRHRFLAFGLAAVTITIPYYFRTQGIFLIVVAGLVLLLKRQWKELGVFALIAGLMALPLFLRNLQVTPGGYLQQLLSKDPYDIGAGPLTAAELLKRLADNLQLYVLRVYPLILLPVLGEGADRTLLGAVGLLSVGLTIVGLVRDFREKRGDLMWWHTVATLAVVMLWPSVWSGDRFLLPIVPLLFVYLYRGWEAAGAWLRVRWFPVSVMTAIALLFVPVNIGRAAANLTMLKEYAKGDRFAGYDIAWRSYFEACLWLRDHTDTNAVVITRKPQFTYLFSGRRSAVYPYISDETRILAALDSLGATHAFLETFFGQPMKYLLPVIRNHPERFEQLAVLGPREAQIFFFAVKR